MSLVYKMYVIEKTVILHSFVTQVEIPLKGPKLIALKTAELALGKVLLEPIFSFSQAIEVIKRVLVLFDTSSHKILLPQNSHRE